MMRVTKTKMLICAILFVVLASMTTVLLHITRLKTNEMISYEYDNFTIYSEDTDPTMIRTLSRLLDSAYVKAKDYYKLPIDKSNIYIYKKQVDFQNKKYPIIAGLLNLDWYIGDNIGKNVLLVSPNTKVNGHTYESIINAIGHELVHTINYRINPNCRKWIDEGMALYFTNRNIDDFHFDSNAVPSLQIWSTNNPIEFADNNGYDYADKYIEFINDIYGQPVLISLIKGGSHMSIIGKDDTLLYKEWIDYLRAPLKTH